LVAHFEKKIYSVNVETNNNNFGNATGTGIFDECTIVRVEAFVNHCYRFVNWTINSIEVSTDNPFYFTASEDVNIVANFYAIEFDSYAVTICERVILLNLKKLAEDGYEITGCRWFKNGIEVTETNTGNEFSFSEGYNRLLDTAPNYYMYNLLSQEYGELCSTEKTIIFRNKAPGCPEIENTVTLPAYPNPVFSGGLLTLEGTNKDSPVYVYNHLGECVISDIATGSTMKLTLDLPQGIYLIRTENKMVRVVVVK
jgi:hypothetical protein